MLAKPIGYYTGQYQTTTVTGTDDHDVMYGTDGPYRYEGGKGQDTYYVSSGDLVIEAPGEGDDWVFSSDSYVLSPGSEVEILGTWDRDGKERIDLSGNEFNNLLVGNDGPNEMWGGEGLDRFRGYGGDDTFHGGLGADSSLGGAGHDSFVFDTPLGPTEVDTIADFNPTEDRIVLDDAIFGTLGARVRFNGGAISPEAFTVGTAATDSSDQLIYNAASGGLYFDADGVGGADAILVANIGTNLDLSWSNFFVV